MSLNHEYVLKEINNLDKQIKDCEKKAKYLEKIESQLKDPQFKPFQKEVKEIKKYLKDLNSTQKVKELFEILSNKISNFNTQSLELKNKLKDLQSTFNISEFKTIDRLLSNPKKIELAKEKISQISKEYESRNRIGFPIELSQYTDIFLIGSGGFSFVYGAKRIKDGKKVAIKIPKTSDKRIGKTFIQELNNWVGLKHRNIVEIYDYNILPLPYIEMELCDSSLDKMNIPLEISDGIKIISEISNGIKYAHKKKIIHLDLKPQNILLKKKTPKITDWGMSRLLTDHKMTTIGLSLPFAAPEQFSKTFGKKDEQTDIWQLGVLLYYLITGNLLFSGNNYNEFEEKITTKNISKSLKNREKSSNVVPLIKKCVQKDKKNRYKSIDQFQEDLNKIKDKI